MKENMTITKKIMFGVAILICIALIFPPYKIYGYGSNSLAVFETGYALIFSLPDRASIDVMTLFSEWIAICIVGFLFIKISEDNKK
jgi:hypothetical protein